MNGRAHAILVAHNAPFDRRFIVGLLDLYISDWRRKYFVSWVCSIPLLDDIIIEGMVDILGRPLVQSKKLTHLVKSIFPDRNTCDAHKVFFIAYFRKNIDIEYSPFYRLILMSLH